MIQLPSMARRRAMRARSAALREVELTAARVGRATQAAHSTVALGEEDVPLVEAVDSAVAVSAEMPLVTEETEQAGDDAWDAWDQSDYAKQLAEQLDTDLSAAKLELEQALEDAQAALTDADLARTEAAQAVADAASAVTNATQAIEDALAAQELAKGASPTWATTAPTADDATGKPVGSIWYVRNGAGQVTQFWELTALGWFNRPFDETVVPQISIGSGTYGTISGERLTAESVAAEQIAALAVTAAKIAADAVTAAKIAANAVTAEKINAGAVTTEKLDALAVTAEKLAAGAVVADKIAANTITSAELAATAIDGMTITGAVMRTAAAGQRMQFDINGLRAFDVDNVVTASLTTVNGAMTLNGTIKMPTGTGTPAEIGHSGISAPLFENRAMFARRSAGFNHQSRDLASSFGTQFGDLIANSESIFLRRRFDNMSGNMRGAFEVRTLDGAEVNMVSRPSRTGSPVYLDIRPDLTAGHYFIGAGPMSSLKFYDGRIEVKGPMAFDGDTALLPWSSFGTYGTGWSDLTATPYEGVKAQVKNGMFYLDIAVQKGSGHVGSEVILRVNIGYRPKGPKMQYAYASGDNFVVAQPDGDIIVAIARAGAGNLTAATLAWSLT